jgi:non-ribosomal peptide synthetase-like protein
VGLLGSPPFEIPRTVERDMRFDHFREGDELRRRLSAKNRSNARTMALFLFLRWLNWFLLTLLGFAAVDLHGDRGALGALLIGGYLMAGLAVTAGYWALVERVITRFRPLKPRLCSIYEPYFWWHERLWKVPDHHLAVFDGTPFKNLIWRLLGVRIGRRVFDDGCYLTERTLVSIGSDTTLGHHSKVQAHSQEDGTFKSDHIVIGDGCTLGAGALVHYGVSMGDGAVLGADAFLMKGEEMPAGAHWGGNPAVALRRA